jgi:hypothetical protein
MRGGETYNDVISALAEATRHGESPLRAERLTTRDMLKLTRRNRRSLTRSSRNRVRPKKRMRQAPISCFLFAIRSILSPCPTTKNLHPPIHATLKQRWRLL